MKPVTWITLALTLLGVIPAALVLGRELYRRAITRVTVRRLERARVFLEAADQEQIGQVTQSILREFDALTTERALEIMILGGDPLKVAWGSRIFVRLQLVEKYSKRLREARKWSERAHAAEVLGLVGSGAAVPALVETLRDPYDDDVSVKVAAAQALARLRNPEVIPLLVKELQTVDENSSRNIAEALTNFGGAAIPALLELLADPEKTSARVWAARILGRIGDSNLTDALVARLYDRNDLLRMAAAESLGIIGDRRALQPLVQSTLRDPAPQVRAHAAGAVAVIEGEGAIDVLVAALADPDYGTRLRVLEAFENMKVRDTSLIEGALRDPNPEVKRRAALVLERVGHLERVVERLASEDNGVRLRAYAALTQLGRAGIVDSIASYIHHPSFEVRAQVARACGDLGVGRVGALLLAAVDDPEWVVRASIVDAIGRLRPEGSVAALVKLLLDPEMPVREAAAEALGAFAITEVEPFMAQVVPAYESGSVHTRLHMVMLAARLDRPEATALLVSAARDPSETVRLRGVDSLAGRPEELAVPALLMCLTDASLEVRIAALRALGSAASAEAFEGLLRALPGAPPDVRDRIADALARGGRQHLIARVDELAATELLDVQLGIIWTLGKLGDTAGVPYLIRFLTRPERELRASAAGALAKIPGSPSALALLDAVTDRDPRTRAAVVNALGKIASDQPRAFLAIEQRLRDPDAFVRNRAAVALGRLDVPHAEVAIMDTFATGGLDDAAVAVAMALIKSESALAQVMSLLAQPKALERIQVFLGKNDPPLRAAFFERIKVQDPLATPGATLDVPAVVAQYEQIMRQALDVASRHVAVEGLARFRSDRSLEILADALTADPAESVRTRSAQVLAPMVRELAARTALIGAVADPSAEVAIVAARALAATRDPNASTALFRRLGAASDESLNLAIEETLAVIHADDPVPFIDRMMGVERAELLVPSIRVLQRIGGELTFPLLKELLGSREVSVRIAALGAVAKLPFAGASEAIESLIGDPHEGVRLAVLEECVSPDSSSLMRIAQLRLDSSVRVRTKLALVLERIPSAATLKVLDDLAADAAPQVRASALATFLSLASAEGLGKFLRVWANATLDTRHELRAEPRAPVISDKLAALLAVHADATVRAGAVQAIGALGTPGYAKHVLPSLRDPAPGVRVLAIRTLSALEDADIRRQIAECLKDPDLEVREAARKSALRSVS